MALSMSALDASSINSIISTNTLEARIEPWDDVMMSSLKKSAELPSAPKGKTKNQKKKKARKTGRGQNAFLRVIFFVPLNPCSFQKLLHNVKLMIIKGTSRYIKC